MTSVDDRKRPSPIAPRPSIKAGASAPPAPPPPSEPIDVVVIAKEEPSTRLSAHAPADPARFLAVRTQLQAQLARESQALSTIIEAEQFLKKIATEAPTAHHDSLDAHQEDCDRRIADVDRALENLDREESRARTVLADPPSKEAQALAERTFAGIIPKGKTGTISGAEQRKALVATRNRLTETRNAIAERRERLVGAINGALSQAGLPPIDSLSTRTVQRALEQLADHYAMKAPAVPELDASFGSAASKVGEFLAAVSAQKAANELFALDVLQREFGITAQGSPLEALAKAAGLERLDEASIRAWSRMARGESGHADLDRAPLINALSVVFIDRESWNAQDAVSLRSLYAQGRTSAAELKAISKDANAPLHEREAARKLLASPELQRALMPQGALDRAAIDRLDQRRERLSNVGIDGRLLVDTFDAGAEADAKTLRSAIVAGDLKTALAIAGARDARGRAWLLEEYAALYGEGSIDRELTQTNERAANTIAGALSLDPSARAALITGIISEPPHGTTKAAFTKHVLEQRIAGLEAAYAQLERRGNIVERTANVRATPEELAHLRNAIDRAKQALASKAPRPEAIELVATAEVWSEQLSRGQVARADKAIAVVTAAQKTLQALAISAGAAAVTLKTLGAMGPTVKGVVVASWVQAVAAIAAGTGAGTIAGTAIALSDESVRAFGLNRGWNWDNVGRDSREAVMMSMQASISAGVSHGLIGSALGSASPLVRSLLSNGFVRTAIVAVARATGSVAADSLSAAAFSKSELDARAIAANGAKTFGGALVLGPLGTDRSGAAARAWDAALGAAEEVVWNAITGQSLETNVAQAMVGSAISGSLHDTASRGVKELRVRDLRDAAEARAAQRPNGGVHGKEVYTATNTRMKDDGPDRPKIEVGALGTTRIKDRLTVLAGKQRMHGAQLSGDGQGHYWLSLTAKDGTAIKVAVFVEGADNEALEKQPRHVNADGVEEAGPARIAVKRQNGELLLHVQLSDRLPHRTVDNVVGHELDEVADILYRRPGATDEEIKAEMQASVFRGDAVAGAKPTAHDRAAAAEYVTIRAELAQYQAEEVRLTQRAEFLATKKKELSPQEKIDLARAKEMIAERRRNKDELEKVMGLYDPINGRDKLQLLRAATLEKGTRSRASDAERQEWHAMLKKLDREYAKAAYRGVFAGALEEDIVVHIIMPEAHTHEPGKNVDAFQRSGISGGHDDAELKRFVADHPEYGYRLVQVGKDKVVGGMTYRKYEQQMWSETKKAWVSSTVPKTTVSDVSKFIELGEAVFEKWYAANSGKLKKDGDRVEWSGVASDGAKIQGIVVLENGKPKVTTMYAEAQWIP